MANPLAKPPEPKLTRIQYRQALDHLLHTYSRKIRADDEYEKSFLSFLNKTQPDLDTNNV